MIAKIAKKQTPSGLPTGAVALFELKSATDYFPENPAAALSFFSDGKICALMLYYDDAFSL